MKKVLITGAGKGLGLALANVFARNGFELYLHYNRTKPVLEQNNAYFSICGNLNNPSTIDKIVDCIKTQKIDIVVFNAGIYESKNLENIHLGDMTYLFQINALSVIEIAQRTIGHFKLRGEGIIVNINSLAALQGGKGETIYAASKAALKGFFQSLQFEVSGKIKVMDVFLGGMKTQMTLEKSDFDKFISPEAAARTIVYNILSLIHFDTMRIPELRVQRNNY